MMESIKHVLFTNWHLMRWLRLLIGVIIGIHALQSGDVALGILSVFILFQAISNTGCCGPDGCDIPYQNKK